MYTLEDLQSKTLKELKEIGWQLNALPTADRRCRQNWIDAIAGVNPPLLQLLEVSPAAETVPEAIEVQAQEPIERAPETPPGVKLDPIEVQAQEPPLESKFGRIIYPRPIAQNAETRPQLPRTESADVHHPRPHPAESVRGGEGAETESPGSEKGDRILAVAGNGEAVRGGLLPHQPTELIPYTDGERPPNRGDNGRDRLESEPGMSQSAIASAVKNFPGVNPDPNPILPGIAFSDRFLATYPPYFGDVRYKAEITGQLNLLKPVADDEAPDPDDFPSIDAFQTAMARWDAENAEALTVSMDSMCEWAPCPDEWYEPEGEILPLKASSMIEKLEVNPADNEVSPADNEVSPADNEVSPADSEFCKCWNFSIPTFDAWCDRANRQNRSDEPPDTGIYARLRGPKPPNFPPTECLSAKRDNPQTQGKLRANAYQTQGSKCLIANQTDTSQPKSGIPKLSRNYPESIPKLSGVISSTSNRPARSPPGGDAM